MSISEAERHEIYELIKSATSDRVANNIMSMLPPVGWADVATTSEVRSVEAGLRGELARLDSRIARLDSRIDGVESRLDVLRADLLGEMHRSIRNQTWALVAWTTGLAGLIVALGR